MPKTRRTGLLILVFLLLTGLAIWWAYRLELDGIHSRLAEEAERFETPFGTVEYARWGNGPPAVFIHGAGGGWDQGQLIARHFVGEGYSWISVSRFGYLGAPLPADASTSAQADALAALLDHLGIERSAILGVSGGVPPAIQLGARHPEKISALVLLSSAPFTPLTAKSQDLPLPAWAYQALFSSDFPYWALSKIAPGLLAGIFDARPELVENLPPEDAEFLETLIRDFMPVTARLGGTGNEGAAIDPMVPHPADKIIAPTLVIHARDDGINPFPIAEYARQTIPGAKLLAFDRGGHMMLGNTGEIREEIRSFLDRNAP
jgi:pimeloyl-ACP methyl ester carboxylesterase